MRIRPGGGQIALRESAAPVAGDEDLAQRALDEALLGARVQDLPVEAEDNGEDVRVVATGGIGMKLGAVTKYFNATEKQTEWFNQSYAINSFGFDMAGYLYGQ